MRKRTDTVLVQAKLLQYLRTAIESFPDVDGLIMQQFKHGQSNPTYLLQVGILVPSYAYRFSKCSNGIYAQSVPRI